MGDVTDRKLLRKMKGDVIGLMDKVDQEQAEQIADLTRRVEILEGKPPKKVHKD